MTSKTIDNIVWFIPFRKLRDSVRDYLLSQYDFLQNKDKIKELHQLNKLGAWDSHYSYSVLNFRKEMKNCSEIFQKYINLIKDLDNESIEIINGILSKITNYNNIEDKIYFSKKESIKRNELVEEFNDKIIKINEELFIYEKYILPINSFEPEALYSQCGMNYIRNIDKIKNKDIIDAGAFIGDTAIILADYTNKNVYSFEPFLKNYNMMLKTIELNKKNNIIPINMALGDENKEINLQSSENIDASFKIEKTQKDIDINCIYNVKMVTLDNYVKENNIEVGLIKTDLEGFEQPFLKGAINTIKEQKPVLIISIYHNCSDFFEIKPMIENLDLGYKFKIIKNQFPLVINETKLLAEVY